MMKRTLPVKKITQSISQKNEPLLFKINTKEYYSSEDLNNYDTAYFIGTHRNLRGIIKKKNIPMSVIMYAYIKNTKIVQSIETYVRAKLYLEAEWVRNNIPKMIQLKNKQLETISVNNNEKIVISENKVSNDDLLVSTNITDNIDIDYLYDIPPAPDILYLLEDEMFKDSDGNVIDIEVRGERDHNKCFFKVKDIMKGFDMPRLYDALTDKRKDGYLEGEHL